ncbi:MULTISPECIES: hypothetical protein [unclassified Colwellia]|uniref:hypothetical protein n=1 Tax=unclassified Colwellia TaxID=196834 RepID=UPI0015F5269B|nr:MULTISPECIES: hypothetical protein [unclassified Colwellia]MBA6231401.1 hypothetical protein [Colwellia sp. MB02u-7]MBA6235347.1 hypothetical protein [Colwellia sp. MB02u-11]MBA6299141.1 hypothetical protein [Colwellia sp. MB3u-22]MBA6313143.1 hypothetical protein [Colwellia sp. MB3u-64]
MSKRNKKPLKEPWLFLNSLFLSSIFFFFGFLTLSTGSTTVIGKREITAINDPFLFYFGVILALGIGSAVVINYLYLKYNKPFKQDK